MSITIESTTDSKTQVLAAIGGSVAKNQEEVKEKTASIVDENPQSDETTEDSEASEFESENEISESDKNDETEESEDEKLEAKPKKKNGFQKQRDRLKSKLSEKDKEIELLRRERDALRVGNPNKDSQVSLEPQKSEASTDDKPVEPNSSDFETYEEYKKADRKYVLDTVRWEAKQEKRLQAQAEKETQLKTEYQKSVESFQSKVKAFEKEAPDLQDVLSDVDDIPLSFGVQDAILSSDLSAQLMYEIAKDRKEFERINSLSAIAAAREIGKIEARLAKSESQSEEPKKQTQAPPPITPIGSKSSSRVSKAPEDMSFKEYKTWRQQQK